MSLDDIRTSQIITENSDIPQNNSKPNEVVTTYAGKTYRHHHPEDLLYTSHPYTTHMQRRLVHKNGDVNINKVNIQKRRRRYLADIFTTLVDIQWRYNLLVFTMAFIISWVLFAVIWYLMAFSHGDLDHRDDKDWIPCVTEIKSFISALLFSIETQHTIGYGSRHTTEECPEGIALMMIQSCFGVICQALMTGIVFAKLSRPKKRAQTLLFSRNACICKVDGEMCLLFRVGDMRKSHLIEAHVRAVVIKKKVTKEGGVIPLYQFDVNLGYEDGRDRLFLVWPVVVIHKIDERSPFWDIGADDLQKQQFELIVILEGIVESTGMTTQARSSYLPTEILWGHYFERLVTFRKKKRDYKVDFSRFHNTVAINMDDECARTEKTFHRSSASARNRKSKLDKPLRETSVDCVLPFETHLISDKYGKSDEDIHHDLHIPCVNKLSSRGNYKMDLIDSTVRQSASLCLSHIDRRESTSLLQANVQQMWRAYISNLRCSQYKVKCSEWSEHAGSSSQKQTLNEYKQATSSQNAGVVGTSAGQGSCFRSCHRKSLYSQILADSSSSDVELPRRCKGKSPVKIKISNIDESKVYHTNKPSRNISKSKR